MASITTEPLTEIEELYIDRMLAAQHAIQTGVLAEIHRAKGMERQAFANDPMTHGCSPKHLRVGVNSAMVETSALAEIMWEKGLCTREEYYKKLAEAYEREHASYEERLGVKLM